MTEVEAQIENVSFMLNGIREEYNHDLLSVCLQELENIKRKIQKSNDPSFEGQENKLLKYFEAKYHEATGIIGHLEDEIEELKDKERRDSFENGNVLVEKSIFWKNSENLPPGRQNYGSHEDSYSLMAMKDALSELEQKNYRNEKENEEDKVMIRQLEALNTQYVEKLANTSRQLEELNEAMEEYEMKFSQVLIERNKLSKEVAHVRSEADIYKGRVEDLEREIDMKDESISNLEGKVKRIEERSEQIYENMNELASENEELKRQKEGLAEKLYKAQQDLKEKFQARMINSEEKKVLIAVNNYYVNSPQTYSAAPINPVNVKEFSTPKTKGRYTAPNNHDDQSSKQNSAAAYSKISKFGEILEESREAHHDLDELNPLSSYIEMDENEYANDSISEFCRETLSGKKNTDLKPIEEEENLAVSQMENQIAERISLSERTGPVSERNMTSQRTLSKTLERQKGREVRRRKNFACLSCAMF